MADRLPLDLTQVGPMGLGSASFYHPWGPVSDEVLVANQPAAEQIVAQAWADGLRLFDTAPMYGGAGGAEVLLGRALVGLPREQYLLSTKVGRVIDPERPAGPHDYGDQWRFDFTRDGVLRSVEQSMSRLGQDRFDIVHLHDPDHFLELTIDQAYPTLAELRDQGVIGAIGAGVTSAATLARLVSEVDLDLALLAEQYSLVEDAGPELALEVCARAGVPVLNAGTLHAGLIDGTDSGAMHYRPTPAAVVAKVAAIAEVCAAHQVPIGAAALAYVQADPRIALVVTGPATVDQYRQNLSWATWQVPQVLWADLADRGLLLRDFVLGGQGAALV